MEDALRKVLSKNLLDAAAAENVANCATSKTVKEDYLAGLGNCADTNAAKIFHSDFRRGKVRKGAVVADLDPMEGLGFLAKEDSFKRAIRDAFKMDSLTFETTYRDWLSYNAKRNSGEKPSNQELRAARAFLDSKLPTRMDGEAWLFRNPQQRSDAFEGVLDDHLPKRLGLKLKPGERRLTMSFLAKNVRTVRSPRFLDATWGYLNLWDWRGKTRPLPGLPVSMDGLCETVAVPPKLNDLNRPIEAIAI